MSDLIVPIIVCFRTEKCLKELNALKNIGVLVKGVLNFVHAKTSLYALCTQFVEP